MLYFLYSGGKGNLILLATVASSSDSQNATGIDLNDEALTNGHDVMDISVELMRLGDFFQSTEMQLYGKNMLAEYLRNFLSRICSSASIFANSPGANEELFNAETNFPQRFCSAVINAFNKERPVKLAQDILADFAFAARIHLFKNHEFLSFIRDEVAPEFGNRVLAAQMDGSVSDVFKGSSVFKHWKDWRVTPTMGTSSKSQGSGLFGTASPGSASASSTASPFGGGVGLFGGNSSAGTYTSVGSTGQTGGFGSTGTNAGGGLFGSNDVTKPPGTVGPAFSPYQENEPNSTTVNSFQSILFHDQYKKFSAEELRMADYSQGRRYGNGQTGGSGGFGTTSGSGRGLFGNTITQNTSFGNTNNAGGGFSFGTATPK